jgi:hypothetical protein
MDNIRQSMTYLARRSSRSILVVLLSPVICGVGNAQVVAGYRAPTDLVDGAVMAVTGGCYLASAGRPVPGINTPAGGRAGEGITEHTSAPDWVSKTSDAPGRSRFSTLKTPEGDIWIRFDEATSRCSLIVRSTDSEKFRSALVESLAKGPDSTRQGSADGSESIVSGNSKFAWTIRVSTAATPDVVLVETTFAQK